MTKPTIADTGVIVGLIYEKDQWHEWSKEQTTQLFPPFLTCEAVITEASYLLAGVPNGQQQLLAFVDEGFLQINFSLQREAAAIKTLMDKYKDVPMDFADACLVRMSELNERAVIFTVDGDFRVYRRNRREQIPLVIPNEV